MRTSLSSVILTAVLLIAPVRCFAQSGLYLMLSRDEPGVTQVTLSGASAVDLNAEGVPADADDSDQVNADFLALAAQQSLTEPVLGGGGGGGGAGGNPGGMGGAGQMGSGLDGGDGADNGAAGGGFGGNKGPAGAADASGIAEMISEINPDDQTVMEWTFIHNNVADLDISGGAGGGGGGGGGGLFIPGLGWRGGGAGGNGGQGAVGNANLTTSQTSGCFVEAMVVFQTDPAPPPGAGTECLGSAVVDIGWVSSGQGTLTNGGAPIWNRAINVNVIMNGVTLNVAGSGNNPIIATGIDGFDNFYMKQSSGPLSAVNGSFSIGEDEFTAPLSEGDLVRVNTNGNSTASSISGNMNATGGAPGLGGQGGSSLDGNNGAGGVTGGSGGAGGDGDPMSGDGGDGGGGFAGQSVIGHEDGFFQGMIGVKIRGILP